MRCREWAWEPWNVMQRFDSLLRVPIRGSAPTCLRGHPELSWVCSRADGHSARHAASIGGGRIVAVWS